MRLRKLCVEALLVLLLGGVACTPRAAPGSVPGPAPLVAPTPKAPSPLLPASPAITLEEATWQKVVTEAKKEGKLTLYNSVLVGDAGLAVAKAFENQYDIKVQTVMGTGVLLVERIRSEQAAGKYIADTVDSAPPVLLGAKRAGSTQAAGYLPSLKDETPYRVSPRVEEDGHLIGAGFTFNTFYVNTSLVKAGQEPQSWKELLDPKWKGKIVIDSPQNSTIMPLFYYVLSQKNNALDKDYFQKLSANSVKVVPFARDVPNVLSRGEVAIGLTAQNIINPLIREGAPIKPIAAAEGVVGLLVPTITVVKEAPHPNAARLFINWLISQEGQTTYGRAIGSVSLRNDVPDFSPEIARVKLGRVFLVDLAAVLEAEKLRASGFVAEIFGVKK